MPFIRKVHVLFKTRLIFSRINDPIVTSLVVGFLGHTLELFCNICDLAAIVNKVNYVYFSRWCCLDRIVVSSEASRVGLPPFQLHLESTLDR